MENKDLRKLLFKIEITANMQGYHFILEAVEIIKSNKTKIKMMKLYEMIGKNNKKSSCAVERAIRHSIEEAYKKSDILQNMYINQPTVSEFIYDLVFNFDLFEV